MKFKWLYSNYLIWSEKSQRKTFPPFPKKHDELEIWLQGDARIFDHSPQTHTIVYITKFSIQTILEFMLLILWHVFPQTSSIPIEFSICLCWNPLRSVFQIYQMSFFSLWPIKQSQLSYKTSNSNFVETEIKALP